MDLSTLTDEELVRLSQDDDRAMDFLLNKYKGVVLSCSKSLFILDGDDQDLVQEGMIGLFKGRKGF